MTQQGLDLAEFSRLIRPMQKLILCLVACAFLPMSGVAAKKKGGKKFVINSFNTTKLTNKFWAEGAHFGDFDKDGNTDIVIGPYWYAGPDFKHIHEYYPATNSFKVMGSDGIERSIVGFTGELSGKNGYSDNFLTYTYDFDSDGWLDILVFGWPGKATTWYQNPGREGHSKHWQPHVVWNETDNESPQLMDVTGDGKPELLCHARGFLGYVELNWKDPTKLGEFRAISHFDKKAYFRYKHGYGAGDIDGDGLIDIVERDGWWKQPRDWDKKSRWKFKRAFFAPKDARGGAQMLVHDFNGDGFTDVATSHDGHGWGLSVYLQYRDGALIHFDEVQVLGSKTADNPYGVVFSQIHALALADMDQDGQMDIVTGKRFWAHGPDKDADPDGAAVLYWFKTKKVRRSVEFIPFLIHDNSGVGTQVTVGDINGDSYPDVVVGNKKGAFVHLSEAKKVNWVDYNAYVPKLK